MIKEFQAETEQEAINLAEQTLNLSSDFLDIEVVEVQKKTLFKKGSVVIRVHYEEQETTATGEAEEAIDTENEDKILDFVKTVLLKMGYVSKVKVVSRNNDKLVINIESQFSSIIIGKRGKNLDAIQTIANAFANTNGIHVKVVLDSENYRMRHEEMLMKNAFKVAEQVSRTGKSVLLDPMNPFERRLVHTALSEIDNITTVSEGDSLYKQIKVVKIK